MNYTFGKYKVEILRWPKLQFSSLFGEAGYEYDCTIRYPVMFGTTIARRSCNSEVDALNWARGEIERHRDSIKELEKLTNS
jgi:hypothetical protein